MIPALRQPLRPTTFAALLALGVFLGLLLGMREARADLRFCNMTSSRVGVALGYRDNQGWVTEGWWNLTARGCETLLAGPLAAQYYYVYAVDYDRGGTWGGKYTLCTSEREFSIRGPDDCLARGYDRSGFYEVDTGVQKSWTIQLDDPGRGGSVTR